MKKYLAAAYLFSYAAAQPYENAAVEMLKHKHKPTLSPHVYVGASDLPSVSTNNDFAINTEPGFDPLSAGPKPDYLKDEYVITTDPEYICESGFTLSGRNCVKLDQKESRLGCRQGWAFEGDHCFGVDSKAADFECDLGFEMKDGECVKKHYQPKQLSCPANFNLDINGCVKVEETDASLGCPSGYTLINSQCHSTFPSQVECPDDMVLVDNECRMETHREGLKLCLSGYSLVGEVCVKTERTQALQLCPEGHTVENGICVQRRAAPALLTCATGADVENGRCRVSVSEAPINTCPDGYALRKNASQSYVCEKVTATTAHIECMDGYSYDETTHKCSKKRGRVTATPTLSCIHGGKLRGGKCEQKSIVPPKAVCRNSMTLNSKPHTHMCNSETSAEPLVSCPAGYKLNYDNVCTSTHTSPVQTTCPSGFEPIHNTMCQKQHTLKAQIQCEAGYTPFENGCRQVVVRTSNKVCPESTTPYVDEIDGSDKSVCIGEDFVAASNVCSEDFQLEEKDDDVVCVRVQKEVFAPRCPPYHREEMGRCVRLEIADKRALCAEGYRFSYGKCVAQLREDPKVLCPVKYHLKSGVCTREIKKDPKAMCPPDFHYDANERTCYYMEEEYQFNAEVPYDIAYQAIEDTATVSEPGVIPPPYSEVQTDETHLNTNTQLSENTHEPPYPSSSNLPPQTQTGSLDAGGALVDVLSQGGALVADHLKENGGFQGVLEQGAEAFNDFQQNGGISDLADTAQNVFGGGMGQFPNFGGISGEPLGGGLLDFGGAGLPDLSAAPDVLMPRYSNADIHIGSMHQLPHTNAYHTNVPVQQVTKVPMSHLTLTQVPYTQVPVYAVQTGISHNLPSTQG